MDPFYESLQPLGSEKHYTERTTPVTNPLTEAMRHREKDFQSQIPEVSRKYDSTHQKELQLFSYVEELNEHPLESRALNMGLYDGSQIETCDSDELNLPQELTAAPIDKDAIRHNSQWSNEWDKLVMQEFFNYMKKPIKSKFSVSKLSYSFLKKHPANVGWTTVGRRFKQLYYERLRDPEVSESEKIEMVTANKNWRVPKKIQKQLQRKAFVNFDKDNKFVDSWQMLENTVETNSMQNNTKFTTCVRNWGSLSSIWNQDWDERVMEEFVNLAKGKREGSFSITRFIENFKSKHNMSTTKKTIKQRFKAKFAADLNDEKIELETKLSMLLLYKKTVHPELREQFKSLGHVLYTEKGAIHSILPASHFRQKSKSPSSPSPHRPPSEHSRKTPPSSTQTDPPILPKWTQKMIEEFMDIVKDESKRKTFSGQDFITQFKKNHDIKLAKNHMKTKFVSMFSLLLDNEKVEMETKLQMLGTYRVAVPEKLRHELKKLGSATYKDNGVLAQFIPCVQTTVTNHQNKTTETPNFNLLNGSISALQDSHEQGVPIWHSPSVPTFDQTQIQSILHQGVHSDANPTMPVDNEIFNYEHISTGTFINQSTTSTTGTVFFEPSESIKSCEFHQMSTVYCSRYTQFGMPFTNQHERYEKYSVPEYPIALNQACSTPGTQNDIETRCGFTPPGFLIGNTTDFTPSMDSNFNSAIWKTYE
ncbi:hypothetical protein L5515_017583 [Caenorhabditis briggsae]|uniref:SPK domain-containing protein n=1 Tax=Caenorhabditis briggsae TaxID=6238 RepID=A0AAE9FEM0_CAEBR|nr:hypothetical protein L5515_017583 [Caenorhabditis briggsae]